MSLITTGIPMYKIFINGLTITNDTFSAKIEIDMNCSFEPDMFKVIMYNVDNVTQRFMVENATIVITLGYKAGMSSKIITGVITQIKRYDVEQDTVIELIGIDSTINKLKNTPINLSLANPTDVIQIIKNIALQAGVTLSVNSIPSGIILNNYTVNNIEAYYEIKKLSDILTYNVTAKLSQLYVTRSIISTLSVGTITNDYGFIFHKLSGITQNSEVDVSGFTFTGNGLSTIVPMKTMSILSTREPVVGTFVIESVKHIYNENGYSCEGTLLEVKEEANTINIISSDIKSMTSILGSKINEYIDKKPTINTGIIKSLDSNSRLITAKIGIDKSNEKSVINKSIESAIGVNNVFVNKKPIMSPFVGDGFGQIIPAYQNTRCILVFNRYDNQDINVIGYLWDKNWTIPEHDEGDYMIHHKNHSKWVMKENGHGIIQYKGLKIQIGTDNLTESKPTPTDDGKLLIEFDNGSVLSYKAGDGWSLSTSDPVEIEGGSIKIGSGASSGAARLNDTTISNISTDSSFWAFMAAFYGVVTGPPIPEPGNGAPSVFQATLSAAITAAGGTPTSQTGKINQASSKVDIE